MNLLKELQKKYFKAAAGREATTGSAFVVAAFAAVVVVIVVLVVGIVDIVGSSGIVAVVVVLGVVVVFCVVVLGVVVVGYVWEYYDTKKEVEKTFQQRNSAIVGFLEENNLYTVEGIDWLLENYKSKKGIFGVISGIVGKVLPVGMFFLGILFQKVSDEDIIKWIIWIIAFLALFIFIIFFSVAYSSDLSRTRKYLIEDLGYIKTQLAD